MTTSRAIGTITVNHWKVPTTIRRLRKIENLSGADLHVEYQDDLFDDSSQVMYVFSGTRDEISIVDSLSKQARW